MLNCNFARSSMLRIKKCIRHQHLAAFWQIEKNIFGQLLILEENNSPRIMKTASNINLKPEQDDEIKLL